MAAISGFQLIVDPSKVIGYYGDIPELPMERDGAYEEYRIDWNDMLALTDDFADPINELCGTLLDLGDVDYFDAVQCVKLKDWLETRLKRPCTSRLRKLYTVLLEYATRAIELGTGVVVDI